MQQPQEQPHKGPIPVFYAALKQAEATLPPRWFTQYTPQHVAAALHESPMSLEGFKALLSPAAEPFLEHMARKAKALTQQHFGRAVQFFTPLYLANHCTNRCLYCGFSTKRRIARHMLTPQQVEAEAKAIHATGLRSVLALTGDAPGLTGAPYLAECVAILARYFPAIGIEVPPLHTEEYRSVVAAGASSMTLFQETYNEALYAHLHPAGPKRDFLFRLGAPERALHAGMRQVTLGALLGLEAWQDDLLRLVLHVHYMQQHFPEAEISVSLPRLRPCTEPAEGNAAFTATPVTDAAFVQIITALRCFLPQVGITLSSREAPHLREHLLPLGVTKISAGVSTRVGGHTLEESDENTPQFAIADERSVEEMTQAVEAQGYQPIFADWLLALEHGPLTGAINTALGKAAPEKVNTHETH